MAKIAIDCDGVLAKFVKAFAEEANRIWPGKFPKPDEYAETEHKEWNFSPEWISAKEVDQVWTKINATPDWWLTLNAHTENVGAMAVWLHTHKGHDIWIVTGRQETAGNTVAYQTYLWLRACGVDPLHNYLGVVPTEHWYNKRKIYENAAIEFSVDDRTEIVEDCDKIAGHKAFLLDRPWNQEAKTKRRIKNLTAFFKEIEP